MTTSLNLKGRNLVMHPFYGIPAPLSSLMTCSRRARGDTKYRCWKIGCSGCCKTYRIIASRIVDDILEAHPDLRWVWWLAVDRDQRDKLSDYWSRLYQRLDYHDRLPDHWLWFVTKTADEFVRYFITDQKIDADWLNHYWERYGGLVIGVFSQTREELRRAVATHCGRISSDFADRRMGSSKSLPGVSPDLLNHRRHRVTVWGQPRDTHPGPSVDIEDTTNQL